MTAAAAALLLLLLQFTEITRAIRFVSPAGTDDTDTSLTLSLEENRRAPFDVFVLRTDVTADWALDTSCTDFELSSARASSVTLRTKSALDFEAGPTLLCAVRATDTGSGTTITITVTINTKNVFDVAPSFSGTASVSCVEETVGACGAGVTFTDSEVAAAGDAITCSVAGVGAEYFTASATGLTCQLSTATKVDRDTLPSDLFRSLFLVATDRGGNRGSASMSVSITDINDNTPKCSSSRFSKELVENADAVGDVVLTVTGCTDIDKGINSALKYQAVGTYSGFSVDSSSGQLKLTAVLDYDSLTVNPQVLLIRVSDSSTTSVLSTTVTAIITALPENDNTPQLVSVQPAEIVTAPEDAAMGTVLFTLSASDADKAGGRDSQLLWSFVSVTGNDSSSLASSFTIDSVNGSVKVGSVPLDYESWQSAAIVVKCEDQGSPKRFFVKTLYLVLTDVNELPPVFTPASFFTVSIAENKAENSTVLSGLAATDPDRSQLPVACSITSGNVDEVFRFRPSDRSVIELAKTLEPDSAVNHPLIFLLQITCKDNNGTAPSRSSTATVQVNVELSNDFTPTVAATCRCSTISKLNEATTTSGTVVGDVRVSDNDAGTDGEYDCSVLSPAGQFTIQSCTTLILTSALDHEAGSTITVTVAATDRGSPQRQGTAVLTVYVGDADDNAPYCLPALYSWSVAETAAVGTSVGTVACRDADAAGVTFRVTGASVPFGVSAAGVVSVAAALDYEAKTFHEFSVQISDSGDRRRTAEAVVRLTVTAVNEQVPTFSNRTVSVLESAAVGSSVAAFAAADSDTGGHGIVGYSVLSVSNSGAGMFSIDSAGNVNLLRQLDYEAMPSADKQFVVVVQAIDGAGAKGIGELTITVTDVNDNKPICTKKTVSLTINENAAANTAATGNQPVATDADSSAYNGKLRYSIGSGNTGNFFQINAATGAVSRSSTPGLNYETLPSAATAVPHFTLQILAVDGNGAGSNTATCYAAVTVSDVEEGSPQFSPTVASATAVPESAAIGTLVYTPAVTHADSLDAVVFSISPASGDFSIDAATGKVYLSSKLDYESSMSHTITLVGKDKNGNTGSMQLTVPVVNVNEFAPVCEKPKGSATLRIDENDQSSSPFPKTVLEFKCSDADSNTSLIYAVTKTDGTPGSTQFNFAGNLLRTKASLNYEAFTVRDYHVIEVTVSDGGPITASVITATVTLSVLPVNEHAPVFNAAKLNPPAVSESTVVGAQIVQLEAPDADKGLNHGTVTFSINSGNDKGNFYLEATTGRLRVAKPLDREDSQLYSLTVQASDGAGRSAIATVTVTVSDVNDNAPLFSQSVYSAAVLETAGDGVSVISFLGKVSDSDATSPNRDFTLSLSTSGVPFKFSGRDLQVAGSDPLKASIRDSYSLIVSAIDSGSPSRTSKATVIVRVVEVNKDPPTFYGVGSVSVGEDIPVGAVVAVVNATDKDSGAGGTTQLSITAGNVNNDFTINPSTGAVTVNNPLDRDNRTAQYNLEITAADGGSPPKVSKATLVITVTDVNDNAPRWSSGNTFTLSVSESTSSATPQKIYTVAVTDPDAGSNGTVTVQLISQSGTAPDGKSKLFSVATNGAILLQSIPDREFASSYSLLLRACDAGSPQLCSDGVFSVVVVDANDNSPKFGLCPKSISVPENQPANTFVASLPASDADAGANARVNVYGLLSADGGASSAAGVLTVDTNGNIRTSAPLDREKKQTYSLNLTATDAGTPSQRLGWCELNVTVSDRNDNAPRLTAPTPLIASVSEAATGGTVFYTMPVADADAGDNAKLLFRIAAFTPANNFTVNDAGQVGLFTSHRLDRERHSQYNVTVWVGDSGTVPGQQTATFTLSINIGDVNDNSPTFGSNSISRSVAENSAVGTNVGAPVVASDADTGENASITYRIDAGLVPDASAAAVFHVHETSGQLTIKSAILNRESWSNYQLQLLAIDNGKPTSLTGTTTVTITVTDVNDHTPQFTANYSLGVWVSENLSPGSVAITFTATDKDAGLNAAIAFVIDSTLLNGSVVNEYFTLNSSTGELTTKSGLDRENISQLTFYVLAIDQGTPALTASARVVLLVQDRNDNRPVFMQSFVDAEMAFNENRTSVTIAQLSASDADATGNSVSYGWATLSRQLVMNRVTGAVTPAYRHNSATAAKYIMYPVAVDAGVPQLTATATLRVDTYTPTEVAVCIEYSVTASQVLAGMSQLLVNLADTIKFKYPTAVCRLWRVVTGSSTTACHYCIQSNTTNSSINLSQTKAFIGQSELLQFWQLRSDGTPTAMLQTPAFATIPVAKVMAHSSASTAAAAATAWYQTPWGISLLVLGAAALLAAAAAATVLVAKKLLGGERSAQISSKPSVAKQLPQAKVHSVPKVQKNKSANVYRDQQLWRGTPEFRGRSVGSNSAKRPTPVD